MDEKVKEAGFRLEGFSISVSFPSLLSSVGHSGAGIWCGEGGLAGWPRGCHWHIFNRSSNMVTRQRACQVQQWTCGSRHPGPFKALLSLTCNLFERKV